jgi:hypothetical protein
MYDDGMSRIIAAAFSRLHSELDRGGPFLAQQILGWIKGLSDTAQPEDYFKHPHAFPMLLLPWWVEKTLCQHPDPVFQADLVYSTVNGYYYIRLMDNVMDANATLELNLLPALNLFHTQFQAPYQRYFEHEHPFWDFFFGVWMTSAEVTMVDAGLAEVDRTQFVQVAAQKTCAAKIPLAAVCYQYEQPGLITPWAHFVELFGCWHQMRNDLFDWRRDLQRQARTYFLSEAERRKRSTETVAEWVVREGFAWGVQNLEAWMAELQALAGNLNSPDLEAYLDTREAMMRKQKEDVTDGLQNVAKLLALFE